MRLSACLPAAAIVAALVSDVLAFTAYPRLKETDLDLELMGYKLPVDPDGKHGPKRVAGYFALNRTEAAEMFYFYFESRNDPKNDPVVLWMTGAYIIGNYAIETEPCSRCAEQVVNSLLQDRPEHTDSAAVKIHARLLGISSEFSHRMGLKSPDCVLHLQVYAENGPFTINKDLTLEDNPYGWDVSHNMIYVDQPIGTGFSYSTDPADTVYGEKGVAHDMLDFLQMFMAAHPELADNDVYITGESYAGHYVPAVSHRVWSYNKAGGGQPINLKGLAIGNGLTDPAIQYGAYTDYALQNGLISKAQRDYIQGYYPHCKWAIEMCNKHHWKLACTGAGMYCESMIFEAIMSIAGNVNVYDIRLPCDGPLCYDFSLMANYLAQDNVRKALGVQDRPPWHECDRGVYQNFRADLALNCADMLLDLLEDGLRVMIYAGEKDLICNWLGNRQWVDALQWSGADVWSAAEDCEWSVDGAAAGRIREAGALSFVKVYNAGHMVPMDQGKNSLDMLMHLTRDERFACPSEAAASLHAARLGTGLPSLLSADTLNTDAMS